MTRLQRLICPLVWFSPLLCFICSARGAEHRLWVLKYLLVYLWRWSEQHLVIQTVTGRTFDHVLDYFRELSHLKMKPSVTSFLHFIHLVSFGFTNASGLHIPAAVVISFLCHRLTVGRFCNFSACLPQTEMQQILFTVPNCNQSNWLESSDSLSLNSLNKLCAPKTPGERGPAEETVTRRRNEDGQQRIIDSYIYSSLAFVLLQLLKRSSTSRLPAVVSSCWTFIIQHIEIYQRHRLRFKKWTHGVKILLLKWKSPKPAAPESKSQSIWYEMSSKCILISKIQIQHIFTFIYMYKLYIMGFWSSGSNAKKHCFKGAVCSFGEEMLMSRERSSLADEQSK